MTKLAWTIWTIHFIAICLSDEGFCDDHPDSKLSTVELIRKYGYPVHVHEVVTEDGYILSLFRIRHGREGKGVNRKPILMMHGLFGQAENFIVNGMNNGSLAYLMADNDYDVWLGNTRGNQHARKHKQLNPDEKEFWNFSWHEIGMYDLPAMIDFILKKSNKTKLHYVGHSQGGTIFYVMASLKPEYQKKIALASLLAPGAFMRHFRNVRILPLVYFQRSLTIFSEIANIAELPPAGISLEYWLLTACQEAIIDFRRMCELIYHFSMGGDSGQFNQEMLPLLVKFIPTVATKQPLHYAQTIDTGHFRPWDYGEETNMEVYGKPLPDDYPVENIKVPIAFYYSEGDNLAYSKDVEDMSDAVANCVRKYLMPIKQWTHMDFLFATNLAKELNEPLLLFAQKYDIE